MTSEYERERQAAQAQNEIDNRNRAKPAKEAKRYNNTVGVSAVRDLYGTMINEGAVKGILVTTSSFEKDSYDFAKDKPIQLINGQEMLGLLEQQGFGAFNISLRKNS